MAAYKTRLGSLDDYDKGGVQVINDDPKNYVFSNIFEVASQAEPYEKIAVGKNLNYVLKVLRADGTSPIVSSARTISKACTSDRWLRDASDWPC